MTGSAPLTNGGADIVKYCIQVSSLEEDFPPDLSDIAVLEPYQKTVGKPQESTDGSWT